MAVSQKQLLERMADLSTQEVDKHLMAMLYGPYGCGKTTLAMWLAQSLRTETGRILYLDSAEGWVSLSDYPDMLDGVDRIQYSEYGELPALANAIRGRSQGFEDFEVVIIDEVDPIADDVLVTLVREKHRVGKDAQLPEIEGKDYRPMGDLMRTAIKAFQKAGVHLILVAHDTKRKDHRNVEITQPSITPKLKNSLAEILHVVGYCAAEIKGSQAQPEYVRTVQALPTKLVEAKTRISALRSQVQFSHEDFIDAVVQWVSPEGSMAEDMLNDEVQIGYDDLPTDDLPTDGIPVSDNPGEDDDEPAYVGTED